MNLFQRKLGFWQWFLQVMGTFLQARPLTTTLIVGATTLARITSFLALMLPLKVILLAGSDGVPRYFRFFIEPDEKLAWIVGLALAAIGLYIATLALDALTRRLALAASGEILESANELTVIHNQEEEALSCYARFCRVCAYVLFSLAALTVLLLVNKWLFLFLVTAITLEFLFSAWAVAGTDDINPGRLKAFVTEKFASYLSVLVSINFLAGFLVILAPFVLFDGGQILFAIISVLLMRQTLGTVSGAARIAVGLEKRRHRINTLVFREFQLEHKERRHSVALRDLFPKEERRHMAMESLNADKAASVDACWQDSTIPAVTTFSITVTDQAGAGTKHYQQQIYLPSRAYQLENEELLFEHIARRRLWAPEVVARFSKGPFECQICEYGQGKPLGNRWKAWEATLLLHVWACKLPDVLVDAFAASRPLLHNRLTSTLLERVELAVDTADEADLLSMVQASLPTIQSRLKTMPLYVYNPDINRNNVVFGDDAQSVLIMTWGRWKLEPLGAMLPPGISDKQLQTLLKSAREQRTDIPRELDVPDLRYVSACWNLDRLIRAGRYKAALNEMAAITEQKASLSEARQVV